MRGLVLAAGASRRAGGAKALFTSGARTYVERSIDTLLGAGAEEIVVVVARPHGEAIRGHLGERARVRVIENPEPERGMLSSVRVGLAALRGGEPVVVSLVDHPDVRTETVRRLVDHLERLGVDDLVVRPRLGDRTGHPVVLDASACRRVIADLDAATLRDALEGVGTVADLDVEDAAVLQDLDGPPSGARD